MKSRTVLQLCVAAFIATCGRGEAVSQTDFWQKMNDPNGDTVSALAIDARGNIVGGTHGGVYRSTDKGVN